jgi:hypothetical protein
MRDSQVPFSASIQQTLHYRAENHLFSPGLNMELRGLIFAAWLRIPSFYEKSAIFCE